MSAFLKLFEIATVTVGLKALVCYLMTSFTLAASQGQYVTSALPDSQYGSRHPTMSVSSVLMLDGSSQHFFLISYVS